jgi:hypothetical protein
VKILICNVESFLLNYLLFKEKLVLVLCVSFAILILVTGIYDFLIVELMIGELVMTLGMFLMLLSAGLTPKLFFSPLTNIFKSEKTPTLGHARVQQWLFLFGVFFCSLSLVIR